MEGYISKLRTLPFISVILVAVNVVVYLLCRLPGNTLYGRGCLSAFDIIAKGEYGRIFWSMFLHADSSHLFSNMIILLFMGAMIEKRLGTFLLRESIWRQGSGESVVLGRQDCQ